MFCHSDPDIDPLFFLFLCIALFIFSIVSRERSPRPCDQDSSRESNYANESDYANEKLFYDYDKDIYYYRGGAEQLFYEFDAGRDAEKDPYYFDAGGYVEEDPYYFEAGGDAEKEPLARPVVGYGCV